VTKVQAGHYDSPSISPTGKWVIATKYDDEEGGSHLVRINVLTGKEFNVETEDQYYLSPEVFVPSLNRFLLGTDFNGDSDEGPGGDDYQPSKFLLLDPETGRITPATGELRPLAQQKFRPLQQSGKANEFWAAIKDREKRETDVGIYDLAHLKFTPVLKIPKIQFDSMDMWVDETERKIYFVYGGQLLSLPLKN
jgi:hypothetical protein